MPKLETLVVGGGCFWCVEAAFELLPGVAAVVSGYAGGARPNPTYEQVCAGVSGHAEVVRIDYDPAHITLDTLFDYFWAIHDPTTLNRQGADAGTQYRSVVFYAGAVQKAAAEAALARANPGWGGRIVTQLAPLETFYEAEAYHQDYFRLNPNGGYCQAVIRPKIDKLRQAIGASKI
jgi:peptide-methionine (S)-S-oxide reductase